MTEALGLALAIRGGTAQGRDLASDCGIRHSALTRGLARLLAAGLIERGGGAGNNGPCQLTAAGTARFVRDHRFDEAARETAYERIEQFIDYRQDDLQSNSRHRAALRTWADHCLHQGVDLDAGDELRDAYLAALEQAKPGDAARHRSIVNAFRLFIAHPTGTDLVPARRTAPLPAPRQDLDEISALGGGLDPVVDAIRRWLLTLSQVTATRYRVVMEEWLEHCTGHEVHPFHITEAFVRSYQVELEASLTYFVARAKMGAIRSFYRFATDDRSMNSSPAAGTTRRPPAQLYDLHVDPRTIRAQEAADQFLLGYKGNTRRVYEVNLKHLFTWCYSMSIDPLELQYIHLTYYQRKCEDAGLKPATINQHLVVMRQFYRHCFEEGIIDRDPAMKLKPARLPNTSTSRGIDLQEITILLAEAQRRSAQDYALVSLLFFNGLRISEALGANLDDFRSERGHRVLMVGRKGYAGSKFPIPLAPRTGAAIDAWLDERDDWIHPSSRTTPPSGPLFVSQGGRRLTRNNFWAHLRTMAKAVLPERAHDIHPHDLRHGFVTLSLDAGVPLRDVQDSAGHASADTTRRYDHNRHNLDRHATYRLAAFLAGSDHLVDAGGEV